MGFLLLAEARGLTIVIDYSQDAGYFEIQDAPHQAARAAVEKAASDLSDALNTIAMATLNAVPTDAFSGADPALTLSATFDWHLEVSDPSNPDPANPLIIDPFTLGADKFTVFVGSADGLASADALGEGAPASGTADLSYADDPASAAAIVSAMNYSNGILLRGAGPTISSVSDKVTLTSSGDVNYTLHLGALASFLSFDRGQTWHFDSTTAPGPGEFDFYTVMLHEMMHGLGFGNSETWNSLKAPNGKDWMGAYAIAANGNSGVNLINDILGGNPDGSHIHNGTMSKTIDDNTDQEAVMTASLTAGVRRKLTQLDIAFLRDLGYGPATAAPTPPPMPTPTPSPTPVVTLVSIPPEPPILAGKAKLSTSKSKITLKGALISAGAYVQYKVGRGPYLKAKGKGSTWKITVKLQPGKNVITIASFDPATGLTSKLKKIVVKRL
jgi:hypothetical protein